MKEAETIKHHKTHKHTISGLVLGSILLIASIIDILILKEPEFAATTVYLTLVPGIVIIMRSMRPPMGVLRALTTLLGGVLVGATPMMVGNSSTKIIYIGLMSCVVGAVLLGISFTEKPFKD